MTTDKQLKEYFEKGGKITRCPDINSPDDLKKYKNQPNQAIQKPKPLNYCPYFIFKNCDNRHNCHSLCYPLTWINGHVPLKEPLANDILPKNYEVTKNYNDVLAEGIESHRNVFDKKISETESLRNRIIVTLLENNYKIKEICDCLHISSKTLYRIKKKRAAKIGPEDE